MTITKIKQEPTPNVKQQEAIDTINGSVMLLAGPGTGKTFTLIQRIENMLSKGVEPSSILCLTFSDAAASEMRSRLIKKMGVIATSVNIYTYHSFCNEIIKENPDQFSLKSDVRLINETEELSLIKECIDEIEIKEFKPKTADRYFYAKDFVKLIKILKSKRLTKDEYYEAFSTNSNLLPRIAELKAIIAENEAKGKTQNIMKYNEIEKIEKNIEKAKDLWNLAECYKEKMFQKSLIDFSDMINFVLDAFSESALFLDKISNKFSYFLVDEYQDTNALQNEIIFNLVDANKDKNIFVVGDDDQIIYGFQGAKLDTLENFLNKYPDTKVICLQENNRSTQSVLDFSYQVISQDESRLEFNDNFKKLNISKRLTAKNPDIIAFDRKVKFNQFGDILQEFNSVRADIVNLINSDACPRNKDGEKDLSQIAVICKKHEELKTLQELLKFKNIPSQVDKGKSVFEIRASILFYFYIKALNNNLEASDKLFGLLLAEPFKIANRDYSKLLTESHKYSRANQKDFVTIMRELSDWKNQERINSFLEIFDGLREFANTNGLRRTVVEILNRTGILEYFCKTESNKMENLLAIKKIITVATELENSSSDSGLADFVKYLDDCMKNEIEITLDKEKIVQNAVQLTTYHSSKGREFEYVYLPNLVAKNWEDYKNSREYVFVTDNIYSKDEAQEKKESELLKLLFVGITRAKYGLALSFADNKEGSPQQLTKFLRKLDKFDFERQQFECKDEEFVNEFINTISKDVTDNQANFRAEIEERVKHIVLSPTRLNDYISCPRKFFYLKVLGIDVENIDWNNANYGSAMHTIFEASVKIAKETGNYPTLEKVIADYTEIVNSSSFSGDEIREKFLKNGIKVLEDYYPHFSSIPVELISDVEMKIENLEVDGDFITGSIDRVEKFSDGTYELYDYKTGMPESEKNIAIGGKKENYYNQLCFYKYAFEKMTGKKVSKVGLIYVADHKKNVYKVLDDKDMEHIENLIKQTYKDIKDLKFNPNKDSSACSYCDYKHLCKLDLI